MSYSFATIRSNSFKPTDKSKLLKWVHHSSLFTCDDGEEVLSADHKDDPNLVAISGDGDDGSTGFIYIPGSHTPGFVNPEISAPLIAGYKKWLPENEIVFLNQVSFGKGFKDTPNNDIFHAIIYRGHLYADWSVTYSDYLMAYAADPEMYLSHYLVPTDFGLDCEKSEGREFEIDLTGDCRWIDAKEVCARFQKFGLTSSYHAYWLSDGLKPGFLNNLPCDLSRNQLRRLLSNDRSKIDEFLNELNDVLWSCIESSNGPLTISILVALDKRNIAFQTTGSGKIEHVFIYDNGDEERLAKHYKEHLDKLL